MLDHFGILAPIYDCLISPPDVTRLRDLLRLPAAGRLLDAGGGTGRVSSQLHGLIGEIVISDLSDKMLGKARAKDELHPVQGHTERLPFPDASFDRVLVVDALHHFCDQREAIAELLRVLKPGGRLVIEEPNLNRWAVKVVALMEKLALMRSRFYSPQSIRDMVAAHGLSPRIEADGSIAAWVVVDK